MASSDDEGETVPNNVSEYKFVDGDEELISFASLPVDCSKGGTLDGKQQQQIYLRGKADNGLCTIYLRVTAWKFDLPKGKPEISVLSVQGNWIKLLKPWRPFNDVIRTVLVALHVLHFAKWNPQRPQKALWEELYKNLSMFERRPCVDDLANHVPLIAEAIKCDEELAKSKLLNALLAEKPWEKKTSNEDVKPPFIVNDADEEEDWAEFGMADENEDSESKESDSAEADENNDSESEEEDCFDFVCAICDNGGDLLICDGKCMRSFHKTVENGDDSKCASLCLTDAYLEAIKNVPFICDNCKYKKHQCFVCWKLGSSDELSNPEVFCCVNGACGYFYHPHCVARLLHPGDRSAAEELRKRIAAGEPFACPVHRCSICKGLEMSSIDDQQFAVCRRCPKAYHRKCLPREIDDGIIQRVWEGLLPKKRALIYCLDHKINEDILTPSRDHLTFPGPHGEERKLVDFESNKNKKLYVGRGLTSEDTKISGKQQKGNYKVLSISKGGDVSRKRSEEIPTSQSSKKQKLASTRYPCEKLKGSRNDEGGGYSVNRSYATFFGTEPEPVNSRRLATGHGKTEMTKKVNPTANKTQYTLTLDADARKRVLNLMKHASSTVTLQEIKRRHKQPSTHMLYSRFSIDQITLGKVEGSIQAVRAALKKLEGGSVQEAKTVCGHELLEQVLKWKDKLKVYLAPFLHGMRYTSFGRHFTKMDKLKEIVDLLHWYVQDDDMLVDFCCGSNDFSCLMKKKLDEMGKRCSFKNYDILQAKNDFNFEKRDWMDVKKEELPDGSKLIMGLNPPFGVNAALANKFINKALEFKPKLLILIVPRETQRLDEKESPYDLIWDDDQLLAGKSFYLPGSVDVNHKQVEDWNVNAPVLYLWSRPGWTPGHRAIAEQQSHRSGALRNHRLDESHNDPNGSTSALELDNESSARGEAGRVDLPKETEQKGEEEGLPRQEGGLQRGINESVVGKSQSAGRSFPDSGSKSSGGKGKKRRRPSNVYVKGESASQRSVSRRPSIERSEAHRETPPRERGEYLQSNRSNLSPFRLPSRSVYTGNDGTNDRIHHLGRGERDRHHHHHHHQQPQQQFRRSDILRYGSHTPIENDGVDELLLKYKAEEPQRGPTVRQTYDPRSETDYAFPATSYDPNPYGRVADVRRMGSPYAGEGYNSNARGYAGITTPVTQRYAPRLGETSHRPLMGYAPPPQMGYAAPPPQMGYATPPSMGCASPGYGGRRPGAPLPQAPPPLGFSARPYQPQNHHTNSGWLKE